MFTTVTVFYFCWVLVKFFLSFFFLIISGFVARRWLEERYKKVCCAIKSTDHVEGLSQRQKVEAMATVL